MLTLSYMQGSNGSWKSTLPAVKAVLLRRSDVCH